MGEPSSHLIVGLGNPGDEYAATRHNIGFCVVDALAGKLGLAFRAKRRLTSAVADVKDANGKLVLAKPLTFMNCSGDAVGALMQADGIGIERLLVVVDDADLELGQLRLRGNGSSGGHRGLASVIAAVGSEEFARLRVGIGRGGRGGKILRDYVLEPFAKSEQEAVGEATSRAVEAAESWRRDGLQKAMNLVNTRQA